MAYSQNSLFHKGIQMYNSLPIEILNKDRESTFERKLKEYVKMTFQIGISNDICKRTKNLYATPMEKSK